MRDNLPLALPATRRKNTESLMTYCYFAPLPSAHTYSSCFSSSCSLNFYCLLSWFLSIQVFSIFYFFFIVIPSFLANFLFPFRFSFVDRWQRLKKMRRSFQLLTAIIHDFVNEGGSLWWNVKWMGVNGQAKEKYIRG